MHATLIRSLGAGPSLPSAEARIITGIPIAGPITALDVRRKNSLRVLLLFMGPFLHDMRLNYSNTSSGIETAVFIPRV
jgi:hypothetical protein